MVKFLLFKEFGTKNSEKHFIFVEKRYIIMYVKL